MIPYPGQAPAAAKTSSGSTNRRYLARVDQFVFHEAMSDKAVGLVKACRCRTQQPSDV
jgi:hypothetical protein